MKRHVRICAMLICMLLLCSFFSAQIFAATMIDSDRPVTLQIEYTYDNKALTGTDFDIYHIATIDAYGELTPTSTFEKFDVEIYGQNDEAWEILTKELKDYIDKNKIVPYDFGKVDNEGIAYYPNKTDRVEQGLYLIIGHSIAQGGFIYNTVPSLVMLPSIDDETNDWTYDVKVIPKPGVSSDQHEEPNKPSDSKLPQTGQLWWPVPVMLLTGLLFISIGLIRRKNA